MSVGARNRLRKLRPHSEDRDARRAVVGPLQPPRVSAGLSPSTEERPPVAPRAKCGGPTEGAPPPAGSDPTITSEPPRDSSRDARNAPPPPPAEKASGVTRRGVIFLFRPSGFSLRAVIGCGKGAGADAGRMSPSLSATRARIHHWTADGRFVIFSNQRRGPARASDGRRASSRNPTFLSTPNNGKHLQ